MYTSVACALGASVNTFPININIYIYIYIYMNTLRAQLIFHSKPSFQQQNPLKNQYLPYLISESCEINSIKSYLLRAFQQQQELPQISIQFSVSILFSFH
jgi:hypothetical protein